MPTVAVTRKVQEEVTKEDINFVVNLLRAYGSDRSLRDFDDNEMKFRRSKPEAVDRVRTWIEEAFQE